MERRRCEGKDPYRIGDWGYRDDPHQRRDDGERNVGAVIDGKRVEGATRGIGNEESVV